MGKYRGNGGFSQSAIDEETERAVYEAAIDRAMREGSLKRRRPPCLPIKPAGKLVKGALRGIPIAYIKDAAGRWVPFADAVDIIEITSVTGEPGQSCIKLKIRDNEAGRAWAGML